MKRPSPLREMLFRTSNHSRPFAAWAENLIRAGRCRASPRNSMPYHRGAAERPWKTGYRILLDSGDCEKCTSSSETSVVLGHQWPITRIETKGPHRVSSSCTVRESSVSRNSNDLLARTGALLEWLEKSS